MNIETVAKLIVMICELIKERSGGTGLEARIADRVLADVAPMLPSRSRRQRRLPRGTQRRLTAGGGGVPPTPDDNRPWLEAFLSEAKQRRWCIDRSCTTCGSSMFRNRLQERAALEAGVSVPPPELREPGSLMNSLDSGEAFACCRAILEAVARLPKPGEGDFDIAAVYFILEDIRTVFPPPLDIAHEPLQGTWIADHHQLLQEELEGRLSANKGTRS